MSRLRNAFDLLRRIWAEMDPSLYTSPPLTLRSLDRDRTEFSWCARTFLFDRRPKVILRSGKVVATYDAVKSIGITEHRDENRATSWSVILEIGPSTNIAIGHTADKTDASIAAAHLATITGKRVRVL